MVITTFFRGLEGDRAQVVQTGGAIALSFGHFYFNIEKYK
jgi:hypothetical protein